MSLRVYTLLRESDGKEWSEPANSPPQVLLRLIPKVGRPLFICEGPGPYGLTWGELRPDGRLAAYGVADGEPEFIANISGVDGSYLVTLRANSDGVSLLDRMAASFDEARELLDEATRDHGIASHECQLVQPWH